MDTLKQQLEQILPKSLDDIVRTNRDKMRIYVSTDEELAALRASVPIQPVKGVITEWNFITLFLVESSSPMVYLTGVNRAMRSSWMTSLVVGIDGDAVATNSGSLYKLSGDRSDQLDLEYICATLNLWGIGQHFGVPPFFF